MLSPVDGGVCVLGLLGFGGDAGCVGQVALASITDPSGHVFVVGVVVDGVNVCVHDGSVGFFVQSTSGGVVPEVQLPAAHVDPDPFPPDVAGTDMLVGCMSADVLLSGLNIIPDMLVALVRFVDVVLVLVTLMGIVAFAGITVKVADLEVDL